MKWFDGLCMALASLSLCVTSTMSGQDTTRVLFLGNSYVYVNELPTVLTELAESMGHVVLTQSNTPGGASLQGHLGNSDSQSLIQQGNWDYVVLQEQSQKASLPIEQVEIDFYPAVASLVDQIHLHNSCAVPLLYMTWGREFGDTQNCSWWPPVCTYEGMQGLITERYLEACDNNFAACAPVGVVWEDVMSSTNMNLYNQDSSHPSQRGTYLAASTMFVAMFGEDPGLSSYAGGINPAQSQTLDAAVWSVWEDQPEVWRQSLLFDANFSASPSNGATLVGVSTSPWVDSVLVDVLGDEYVWEDGDQALLDLDEDVTVSVTAYSSCGGPVDFTEFLLVEGVSGWSELSPKWSVYPNPVYGELNVDFPGVDGQVLLRTLQGQTVRHGVLNSGSIQWALSGVSAGHYVVEVRAVSGLVYRRLVFVAVGP